MKNKGGFRSIRWQMTLVYFLLMVVGFAIVLIFSSQIIRNFLIDQRVDELQGSFGQIADALPEEYSQKNSETLYRASLRYANQYKGRMLILDENGVVQVDSRSQYNGWRIQYDEVARVLWGNEYHAYGYHTYNSDANSETTAIGRWFRSIFPKEEWSVFFVQAIQQDNKTIGAMLMSVSIQDELERVQSLLQSIAIVLGVVLFSTVLLSTLITRTITKPIADLTQVIRKMSRGELNQEVSLKGSSEIVELGKTFNDMSKRLEQTDRIRNDFVSSASHEIKTPLATMKILVESLLYQEHFDENMTREFLGDINSEISRLDAVITDLLRLVQAEKLEEDLSKDFKRINVRDICEDVDRRLHPLAERESIELNTDLKDVFIMGDAIKLEQALFNLVDNAIKYTNNGGAVFLKCEAQKNHCLITVTDTGVGIPKEDLPKIFERFYRVDKARDRKTGGTGLGLSIVERMIKMHGGEISVNSEEDLGTQFEVRLPLA